MIKCAIVGASGYIGGELIRLLCSHPEVELVSVTANDMAGSFISKAHPNLSHLKMTFNELHDVKEAEVIFLALPHGKAMMFIENVSDKIIIDTSGDFRLKSECEFEKFYNMKHAAFHKTNLFCYGLPELFREQIIHARYVAAPGCFATAAILSLYPLIAEGLCTDVMIHAVTGSSGSGAKPKENTHHAFRTESFYAYESFTHRHIPEIKQALFDKTGQTINLIFQPYSGSFVRGIHATSVTKLNRSIDQCKLKNISEKYYSSEYFVRMNDTAPNIKWVQHTNFCDLHYETNGETVIVTAVIDNLLKGGAAQAVQCFNIMNGFHEQTGLECVAHNP